MKKICMVVDNSLDHDSRVNKEAASLAKAGYEVVVYAQKTVKNSSEEKVNKFLVKRASANYDCFSIYKPWRFVFSLQKALKELKAEKADVYHAHDLPVLPLCYLAAKANNSKVVYDSHELYLETLDRKNMNLFKYLLLKLKFLIMGLSERKLIGKVDLVITVNESIKEELKKRYKIKAVETLLNVPPRSGVVTSRDKFKDLFGPGTKVVLYQGAFGWLRGLRQLLESVVYWPENFGLVLMGGGPIKTQLEKLARNLGIEKKIVFLESVPLEQLLDYTSSADLGVVPMLKTNLNQYLATPNKLFEYLVAGLPVAVSNMKEMKKLVEEEEIGVVFDPENPKEIASKINQVLNEVGVYEKMKNNALKAAEGRYNWQLEEKKLFAIYKRLTI
ncbi:MAG: glycosyltransferase family 4 protein [bacterium]|nr:glycosyltransferase family 4 protein [bacterium]